MSEERYAWPDAPAVPSLAGGEVHVWRSQLDFDHAKAEPLLELLSPDERERADRYRFERDRTHFIVARGLLRVVLGRYLDLAPHLLRFTYNPYGKPALGGEMGNELRFNVSHSHGLALFAVASGREIGVDLEHVRADLASLDVAERFFSRTEVAALCALPPDERTASFFDCWTRKEAYIKARGEGLSHPLHRFAVSLGSGGPVSLSVEGEPGAFARWSLIELFPAEGYRAALAAEGGPPAMRCWQVPQVRVI